jgi:diguanylate cyclase
MQQAVQEHVYHEKQVSLLAIDVDHFKSLNDTHGHAVGDRVLTTVGQILSETLREEDDIFRVGGEEFTAVLIGADEYSATETAERVRQRIANHTFNISSAVTVSIGVSEHRYDENWENWAKRGDDRLYAAKRKGRNRVVAAQLLKTSNVHLVNLI